MLSFSALYLCTYFVDGAVNMQPQNYICFAIIATFGNLIQHMTLQDSEKYKADILELNLILQQEATVDDLTQLKNRKALRSDFDKHIGRINHVVMADIDRFKSYNDTYGHVVGDKVLRMVAAATMKAFSGGETYRYGGDEFLIVLADCTDEEFSGRIAKWKEELQAIQIPQVTPSITCSYGYERCWLNSTEDLRIAIKRADEKLYLAKKTA